LGQGFHLIDEGVQAFVVTLEGGDAADYEGVFGDAELAAMLGFLFRSGPFGRLRADRGEVGGVDEAGDEEVLGVSEDGFRDGCVVVGLGGMLEVGEAGEGGGGFVGYVGEDDVGGIRWGDLSAETKRREFSSLSRSPSANA